MDIEKNNRKNLISHLSGQFNCIEECQLRLLGFNELLRADVVAIARSSDEAFVLAFEVKVPTEKWELKHWLDTIRQAGNYSNCELADERAGVAAGSLVNASFIFPAPDFGPWDDQDSQNSRFYRSHDIETLRGAVLLAQHFKVGVANCDAGRNTLSLKLGTDPIWDNKKGFRKKAENLLLQRKIGSLKRKV